MGDRLLQHIAFAGDNLVLAMDLALTFSLLWLAYRLLDHLAGALLLGGDRHSHAGLRLSAGLVFGLCGLFSTVPAGIKRAVLLPLTLRGIGLSEWYFTGLAVVACIWMGGVFFHLARYCRRRSLLMKSLADLPGAPAGDRALAEAVKASGIACPPRCRCVEGVGGIALCGLLQPVLLVPRAFFLHFSHEERYLMYLHECAHIRRRDPVRFLFCDLLEIFFWIFPPLRAQARYARQCCEIACDRRVLRTGAVSHSAYRRLLLHQAAPPHRLQIGFSSGDYRELKARLRATARDSSRKTLRAAACSGIVLLGAVFLCRFPQSPFALQDWEKGVMVVYSDQSRDICMISPDTPPDGDYLLCLVREEYPGKAIRQLFLCRMVFYWDGILCDHAYGDGSLIYEAADFFP